MLLSFSVENFKSFKEKQVLDLSASTLQPPFSWLDNAAVPVGKGEKALRVKAVYGANASGKSNLIKALEAMLDIAIKSARVPLMISNLGGFGFSKATQLSPTKFEIIYVIGSKRYRYGFLVDKQRFHEEWLFDETVRRANVFTRKNQKISVSKKYFDNFESVALLEKGNNELYREDASFLSALALFNAGPSIRETIAFFSKIRIINNSENLNTEQEAFQLLEDKEMLNKVIDLLKFADIHFNSLFVMDKETNNDSIQSHEFNSILQEARGRLTLVATHKIDEESDKVIAWLTEQQESQGTQKLLVLAPYIVDTILKGGTLIIDEFEAKLHTRLSREIVAMFNSATGNPNNAQFIFSTHDTNLLDHRLLRRDQIDFVEKGEDRASTIYSLSDIKGIRKEADFERDYLGGSYGAVPEVTDFNIAILED